MLRRELNKDIEKLRKRKCVMTRKSDLESECFPAIPISEAEGVNSTVSTLANTNTSLSTTTTTNFTTPTTTTTTKPTTTTFIVREPSDVATLTTTSPSTATTTTNIFRKSMSPPPMSPILSHPGSPDDDDSCDVSSSLSPGTLLTVPSLKTSMGLVRPSAVVVTQRSGSGVVHSTSSRLGLSSLSLRLPSTSSTSSTSSVSCSIASPDAGFYLPPTPPSCSSSDSECGSQSPTRTPPLYETLTPQFCNPRKSATRVMVSTRNPINTPLISSQPKGATGAINLTEEEKRTLLSEGYNIPTRLPLTKSEEKSLKKIRRKIKNKISAQESRRKKKDYMDALERKVEKLSTENMDYKRRIEVLQTSNSQLVVELQRLQTLVEADEKNRFRSSPIAALLS
ncbi:hypothetical protein Pmani_022368 [Petrolisthes manimaculis]|uniref:BZIP domain-containing protein n=1 Tax=Petrolisthes manimaculis TaxID=1843537 RepID=A0AAE1PC86_9EUCA|nr:hypothetical protein Pmani_022368 [Petrolisthes manimaculis]